jgi:hypothetical protein
MQHYIIMVLYSYLQVKSVISKVVISEVNLISMVLLVSLKHLLGSYVYDLAHPFSTGYQRKAPGPRGGFQTGGISRQIP